MPENPETETKDKSLAGGYTPQDREIPPRLKRRMESLLAQFRNDLGAHPYCSSDASPHRRDAHGPWRRAGFWGRPVLTAAGGSIVTALLLLFVLLYDRPPTWAEVERQFGDLRYCTISVYMRNNPHDRPVFAQYWFGPDGRARAHVEDLVVFLAQDAPMQTYHLKSRRRSKPAFPFKSVLRALEKATSAGAPTLRTVIAAMAGEGMADTTNLVISDPQVSQDLMVFDAASRDNLWWLRVWALRESRLPIRILKWHRRTGRFVDLQFTYAKAQQPGFFDPDRFAARLSDPEIDDRQLLQDFLLDQSHNLFPSHRVQMSTSKSNKEAL